ncbi:MAG: DUF5946 family protein [Gemmatimonadaceae bacterium]
MHSEKDLYHELCAYTLTLGDATFIHQHVVDAFAAQRATVESKPISVAFALAGLYLHLEKGLSGRQVQLAHMKMARQKRTWPTFVLPGERGSVTVAEVMALAPGNVRNEAIDTWCAAVWDAFAVNREAVVGFLRPYGLG